MYYAVAIGKNSGIYHSWSECKEQIHGISNAKFKKFNKLDDAQKFIQSNSILLQMNITLDNTEKNEFYCFTDGSCLNNGKKNSIASWAVIFPEHPSYNSSKIIIDHPTNNRGELLAIINAIEISNEIYQNKPLYIYTDSEYVINCMTKWIKKWKINGWINSKNKPVENKDLLQNLDSLISFKIIHFKWVHAHSNLSDWKSKYNNEVDNLAKKTIYDYLQS